MELLEFINLVSFIQNCFAHGKCKECGIYFSCNNGGMCFIGVDVVAVSYFLLFLQDVAYKLDMSYGMLGSLFRSGMFAPSFRDIVRYGTGQSWKLHLLLDVCNHVILFCLVCL